MVEAIKKADLSHLKTIVPETLLNLDQVLNYRFVIDPTFLQMLKEMRDGLDFKTRHIDALDSKLNDATTKSGNPLPLGLHDQITYYETKIAALTHAINIAE